MTKTLYYGRKYHKTNLNRRRLKKIIDFLRQVPDIRFRQFCGERILAYRKLHGISHVKLAKIIDIHKTTLRQWAKTQHCPSIDILEKLSSILDGISKENK